MTVWHRLFWAAVIMGCVLAAWWLLSSRLPIVEEIGAGLRNEKLSNMLQSEKAPDPPSAASQVSATRQPSHRTPMRRGANVIHGLVKDADGAPVADIPVRVALVDHQDGWPVHVDGQRDDTLSDDTGAFELKYMPDGIVVFIAETDGMAGLGMVQLNTAWQTEYDVVIVMEPALAIAGRVVDEAGNAIAGATVFPFGDPPDAGPNSKILSGYGPVFTATTEDDGAFSLSPIFGSAVTLLAHADAYAPLLTDPLESGSTDNIVVLSRGTTISGHVLSVPDHDGVPGVTVLVSHDGVPTTSHAVTDDVGAFIVAGVPDGEHWLDVEGTEWLLAGQLSPIAVADGEAVDGVDVYVGRGGVVEGRVYDPATGEAIAGVKVALARSMYRSEPSRHDGSYRIEGVCAGSYQIVYESTPGIADLVLERMTTVRVEPGGPHHVDIAIPMGTPLTGRVTTKEGAPIQGALVLTRNHRGISCKASSHADGTFVLCGHEPGDVIHVDASKDGYLRRQLDNIMVGAEHTNDLALVLDLAARLQGRVTDSTGRPVAGVPVLVDAPSGDQHRSAPSTVFTDPAGDFDIRSIEAGTWSIRAAREMLPVPTTEGVRTVDAVQGKTVRVDLELPPVKDYVIAGFVRDTAGAPRAKVQVRAQPLMLHEAQQSGGGFDPRPPEPTGIPISTTTDAAGHFELTVHQDGLFRVGAQTRAAQRPEVDVHTGDTNVELVIARAAGIEGHIVSAATGKPIPQFELLTAQMVDGVPAKYQSFHRYYDPDGSFRIDQVQPGALTILARAPGGTVTSQVVEVADGETLRGVVLRIVDGATVVGTVRDAQGAPVPGAFIFVGDVPETYELGNQQSAAADASGAYVVEFLPAGVTTISAYQYGHMLTSRTVTLRAGQENTVDLVLNSGGVLSGRVMQGQLPVPYARVGASPLGGAYRETTSDALGRYKLSGLRTATYNVSAQTRNAAAPATRQSISVDADVDERYQLELDLLLPAAAVTLEGVITSDNSESGRVDISGIVVADEQQVRFETELIDERSYRIDNLPAGRISVSARLHREGVSKYLTKSAEIDAGAGGDFQQDFHFKSIGSLRVAIASEFDELIIIIATGEIPWDGGAPVEFTRRMYEMCAATAPMRSESPEWLFDTLEHGRYTVFASGTLGKTPVFDYAIVDIDGEEPIYLELRLRER